MIILELKGTRETYAGCLKRIFIAAENITVEQTAIPTDCKCTIHVDGSDPIYVVEHYDAVVSLIKTQIRLSN